MLRVIVTCAFAVALVYGDAPAEAIEEWEMKFQKIPDPMINPILGPIEESTFRCPVRRKDVNWEAKDVFNPAAVVKDGSVYLLYRAEDRLGAYSGTSRIGLAWSDDGYTFEHRLTEPVVYPAHDDMNRHEWDGGCEDPRVVESPSGEYVMTYTSYDGTARLSVATSRDLIHWEKRGPAFANAHGHAYRNAWTKSGAIVVEPKKDGRLVAAQINGTYWMYWGENDIHVATSTDLINWVPLLSDDETHQYRGRPDHSDLPTGAMKPVSVLRPRRGKFDSNLVEPGPPAILRDDGILFIYNAKNVFCDKEENAVCVNGESDTELAPGTYSAGQALFSRNDPTQLLKRSDQNFFKPTEEFEITGQVGNVCFLEGMVFFNNKWLLYYGTADSKIAVAESYDCDYQGRVDPRKRGSAQKKPMFQPVRDNFSPEEISSRVYNQKKKKDESETSTAKVKGSEKGPEKVSKKKLDKSSEKYSDSGAAKKGPKTTSTTGQKDAVAQSSTKLKGKAGESNKEIMSELHPSEVSDVEASKKEIASELHPTEVSDVTAGQQDDTSSSTGVASLNAEAKSLTDIKPETESSGKDNVESPKVQKSEPTTQSESGNLRTENAKSEVRTKSASKNSNNDEDNLML